MWPSEDRSHTACIYSEAMYPVELVPEVQEHLWDHDHEVQKHFDWFKIREYLGISNPSASVLLGTFHYTLTFSEPKPGANAGM